MVLSLGKKRYQLAQAKGGNSGTRMSVDGWIRREGVSIELHTTHLYPSVLNLYIYASPTIVFFPFLSPHSLTFPSSHFFTVLAVVPTVPYSITVCGWSEVYSVCVREEEDIVLYSYYHSLLPFSPSLPLLLLLLPFYCSFTLTLLVRHACC